MQQITRKNPKLGNYLHYTHQSEARWAGYEQVLTGYQQVIVGHEQIVVGHEQIELGTGEDGLPIYADGEPIYANGDPIYENGDPIYVDGEELFAADWDEAWGDAPSDEFLSDWEEPEPEPQAPVSAFDTIKAAFDVASANAPSMLNNLKAAVWVALVDGGMAPDAATAAGVALVLRHAAPLAAFEAAGGHPDAAAALYSAISSKESVAALTWLTEPILAIFAAALVPS